MYLFEDDAGKRIYLRMTRESIYSDANQGLNTRLHDLNASVRTNDVERSANIPRTVYFHAGTLWGTDVCRVQPKCEPRRQQVRVFVES